jgi:hypothetical protein
MYVRVEHVDLIDDITLGVAEGVELWTDRIIRFVAERGDLNGLALALEAGARPVYRVDDPTRVIAIDGVYPHDVAGRPEVVESTR